MNMQPQDFASLFRYSVCIRFKHLCRHTTCRAYIFYLALAGYITACFTSDEVDHENISVLFL